MSAYDGYLSPFSWRYASEEMRALWSESHKRRVWRSMWVALAQVQSEFGLVQPEQVEDMRAHVTEINIPRALEIENEIHHDLMAEVHTFAEQCGSAKGIIHLGATSMDIEDNADAVRLRASVDIILQKLAHLIEVLAEKMEKYADVPCMAFTHLQPAEPTTIGYRLAFYAQDLLADWEMLRILRAQTKGKGFKGAVGTGASYGELLGIDNFDRFEARLSELLGLPFYPITNQISPRRQDYVILSTLSSIGASLHKFAFDLRLLQSPMIGEWSEPFGAKQVGSSAMPFKRNPINAEKIDSLARMLAQMPPVAWQNAANTLLERTLDDSANRRSLLPEAFLISDELLKTSLRIINGLVINESSVARNLALYAPFAGTERILMALSKAGADRQEMHEHLRNLAMTAWQSVRQGEYNPLTDQICTDDEIRAYLSVDEIRALMQVDQYVGVAPQHTRALIQQIRSALQTFQSFA